MNEQLTGEIETVLAELRARWDARDLDRIRELWDLDDDAPLYQPEELQEPLTSWDKIDEYWQSTESQSKRFSMRTWDLRVKPLGNEYAIAWYRMQWNGEIEGYDRPIGGQNRVSATLRRTPGGWRFCQLIEAPIAPLLYMKWLYEKAVDADFLNSD